MLTDADYMARALLLARRGLGRTSPNPVVGAIVVGADGVVVGRGYHAGAGTPHAEVRALEQAGPRARGATLYCTLEPCCHTGRTGPCVDRIVAAGVGRVVAAVEDPNPQVSGGGFRHLRDHGVAVTAGVGAGPATALNLPFFTYMRQGRPYVLLKAALSLDGRLAAAPGRRTRLTSAGAVRHAHGMRARVDAVGIGSGTLLADDPLLTVREVCRERPLARVVFDTRLRTPASARLFSTLEAGPVIIVSTRAAAAAAPERVRALEQAGADLDLLDSRDIREALSRLGRRGVTSLILEGGAAIHAAAWRAGVVDRVQVYVAPVCLGPGGGRWLDGRCLPLGALRGLRTRAIGRDVLIDGYVHGTD